MKFEGVGRWGLDKAWRDRCMGLESSMSGIISKVGKVFGWFSGIGYLPSNNKKR